MPFDHRDHEQHLRLYSVDDAIPLHKNLTNGWVSDLGDNATCKRVR